MLFLEKSRFGLQWVSRSVRKYKWISHHMCLVLYTRSIVVGWVPNSGLYLIHTTGCKLLYTTDILPIVPICLTFIVREIIQNFPIQRCRWRDFRRVHPSCFVRLEQPVLRSMRFSESLRGVVFGRINHYVKEFWLVFRFLFKWKGFAMKLCFLFRKISANSV